MTVSDTTSDHDVSWVDVCDYRRLTPERGVAVLLPDGRQVALFRLLDGSLHAVDHRDPRSGANVMARGIVGSRGEVPTLASPMYKEVYDLRTGQCLDDPALQLALHTVRVRDGVVEVGPAELPGAGRTGDRAEGP
ncbi:MAG: nitrite reductase small subunit NirD [Motilibacteraceae bacterium]